MIKVVNKKHFKGKGIYIGRPGCLGNPFIIGVHGNRDKTVERYGPYIKKACYNNRNPWEKDIRKEMDRIIELSKEEDGNLICWCAPKRCHGDVIKEMVELNSYCDFPVYNEVV